MSCLQKIGAIYSTNVQYFCNNLTVVIGNVTHQLNQLIAYTENSATLSNGISTFELYTPAIDIIKVLDCFSCKETVRLENIDELKYIGSVINSFNTNSNNTNSNNTQDSVSNEIFSNIQLEEQLNRIEAEVKLRNKRDYDIHLLILTICLIIIGIIIFLLNSL